MTFNLRAKGTTEVTAQSMAQLRKVRAKRAGAERRPAALPGEVVSETAEGAACCRWMCEGMKNNEKREDIGKATCRNGMVQCQGVKQKCSSPWLSAP